MRKLWMQDKYDTCEEGNRKKTKKKQKKQKRAVKRWGEWGLQPKPFCCGVQKLWHKESNVSQITRLVISKLLYLAQCSNLRLAWTGNDISVIVSPVAGGGGEELTGSRSPFGRALDWLKRANESLKDSCCEALKLRPRQKKKKKKKVPPPPSVNPAFWLYFHTMQPNECIVTSAGS